MCKYPAALSRHRLAKSGSGNLPTIAANCQQSMFHHLKESNAMSKSLLRILMAAAMCGGVALAQAASPQSTSPSQQPDASSQQSPTSPSQAQPGTPGQTSSASLTQAQSQIQDALTKQMPSSSVSVSVNSDNQLQLTGTVASQSDKQHAEDIARSAAPGQTIVNNIKVSGSSSDTTNPK